MATDFEDERKRKSKNRRKLGRAVEQYQKTLHVKAFKKARVRPNGVVGCGDAVAWRGAV